MDTNLVLKIPTTDEKEHIRQHILNNKLNRCLLTGIGIFITAFMWFTIDADGLIRYAIFLPGFVAIATGIFLKHKINALNEALKIGVTFVPNVKIEAKDNHQKYGFRLKIMGHYFTVSKEIWNEVSKGDSVNIKAIPKANLLFELKKNDSDS